MRVKLYKLDDIHGFYYYTYNSITHYRYQSNNRIVDKERWINQNLYGIKLKIVKNIKK
jgi:hypothetical protein